MLKVRDRPEFTPEELQLSSDENRVKIVNTSRLSDSRIAAKLDIMVPASEGAFECNITLIAGTTPEFRTSILLSGYVKATQ